MKADRPATGPGCLLFSLRLAENYNRCGCKFLKIPSPPLYSLPCCWWWPCELVEGMCTGCEIFYLNLFLGDRQMGDFERGWGDREHGPLSSILLLIQGISLRLLIQYIGVHTECPPQNTLLQQIIGQDRMIPTIQPRSPTNYHPEPNLTLIHVLTALSQTLTNTTLNPLTPEQTLIRLLQKIDPQYFQHKFALQQAYDYEIITKYISDYYNDHNGERIRKIYLLQFSYVSKFKHLFQLVIDLAMGSTSGQKEQFIEAIIGMGDREKEILMPYFEEVTKRKFIEKLTEFQLYTDTKNIEHTEQDQLLDLKQQQYQQLKQNYQDLSRAYHEHQQNHNNMRQMYEKTVAENTLILQEKYQLMSQLGVSPTAHFIDIAEKYKKDMQEYARELERLNKDIEQRNTKITSKDKQIKMLNGEHGRLGVWQTERTAMQDRIKIMETEIRSLEAREQKLREELETNREQMARLKDDIEGKEKQIQSLLKTKTKYKGIKEVHLEFKKNFLNKTRQT